MKVWLKRLTVGAAVLGLLVLVALEIGRWRATRAGVVEVELPAGSEILARSSGSDYADAYRLVLRDFAGSLEAAGGVAPDDPAVFRDEKEVIFEGRAPGLRFLLSYYLVADAPGGSSALTVSTVVFYETWVGTVYFTPVKVGHRRLVPMAVPRMARNLEREPTQDSHR